MSRAADVAIAGVLLVLVAPLLAVVSCAILLTSGRPVVYRGPRVGRDGRPFHILKLRTMRPDSDAGRHVTVAGDDRVTRVGRLLRLTKLDELPQLVNVLRGDMALVGPRPESPRYVARYTPEQRAVLSVRPGITGAAQVAYSQEERLLAGPDPEAVYLGAIMPDKLAIDLAYVRSRSAWLDLRLIALTLVAVFRPVRSPLEAPPAAGEARPGLPLPGALSSAAIDLVVVAAAYEAATVLRFVDSPDLAGELAGLLGPCVAAGAASAAVFAALGLHRRAWRYASLRDGLALVWAVCVATLVVGAVDLAGQPLSLGAGGERPLPVGVVLGGGCLSFLLLGCVRVLPKVLVLRRAGQPAGGAGATTRVLIAGAGDAGANLAARLLTNHALGYRVVGFVDDDPAKRGGRVRGVKVLGPVSLVPELAELLHVDLVAIAMPSAPAGRIADLIALCQRTTASIKIVPGVGEVVGHEPQGVQLREPDVADLLGRQVVPLRTPEMERFLEGLTVLVTGAAGSIGAELCRQLVGYQPRMVVALDNNETGLFELAASLPAPTDPGRLRLRIGDITDQPTMLGVLAAHRPDVVFHAAAYKHVPLLEEHPAQAARINVLGTYDLCRLCTDLGVGVFVFVSSDKAADPVNVLGASKRLGELIVQAMASGSGGGTTRFCAVRFGNVIGSRGSVVPTFVRQLEHGGPVTVTDARATRYFMTIAEACGLVILTATVSDAGGTYLLDMGAPVRIAELAEKIIRLRGLRVDVDVPIAYTGLRAGERLHEVLLGAGESLGDGPHPKVARIAGLNGPPARRAVAAWARELRAGLDGDEVWLRQRLLELSHGGAASPPPERAGTAGAGRRPAVSRRV